MSEASADPVASPAKTPPRTLRRTVGAPWRRLRRWCVHAPARLRRSAMLGGVARRIWPHLGARLRCERTTTDQAMGGGARVVEGYLGRRRVGRAYLARMMKPTWDNWWVGVEVEPLYRQRGAATRLMRELQQWARELDLAEYYAAIRKENRASLALFGGLGWTRVDDPEMERRAAEHFLQTRGEVWTVYVFVPPP